MVAGEELYRKWTRWRGEALKAGERGLSAPAVRLLAELGVHGLLGAVLAGTTLFGGYAPFGVALVAASGTGLCGGAALLGAGFGSLMLLPFPVALRYLSAAILTFSVAFAFYDVKFFRRPWTMAIVAGVITGCTGLVYLAQGTTTPEEVILFLTETALTVGAAYCFRQVLMGEGRELDDRRKLSLLVLVCCALASLSGVYLWKDISLGRSLGAVCVLAGAWKGGSAVGAVLGVSLGLTMDMAGGQAPLYAMAWGTAALCAGLWGSLPRYNAAAAFLVGQALSTAWLWEQGPRLSALWEVILAGVVFLSCPQGLWKELSPLVVSQGKRTEQQRGQAYVRRRLEDTSAAFRSLYESLRGAFRAPRNDNDVAMVFDRAAWRVCRRCTQRSHCWERDYAATFNALNDATAAMLDRGKGRAEDFPKHFADRCVHFPAFLGAVNEELTALLCRRQYDARLRESRLAVCRQYGELSALLGRAAAELSRELTPDLAGERRLGQYLAAQGWELEREVFRDEFGRLRAHIRGEGWQEAAQPERLEEFVHTLGVPLRMELGEEELVLIQQEPLMAVAGVAARKKDGETVSGDAGTYFKREDGTLYVLLCDGMGSGALANRESSLAVRLLEQFLQAGVETEHALLTLNSALSLRGEEEGGFTTVDLLQVDLFTGEGSLFKLGAAPTYLRRGTTVRKITGTALPAGLGESCRPDHVRLRLEPGDCLLMVSDGVSGAGEDSWIAQRLARFDGDSPKDLARSLITDAPEGATDDRTALVVKLEKRT